ncbi:hypothetical protein P3T23_004134 [Paraburkholderia sp. GAS448]|uniref:hypothetical protein n=1 Tax=Paraburkholderia sp. GAS448 TaxID=3035136 RepID=UPI003D1D14E2
MNGAEHGDFRRRAPERIFADLTGIAEELIDAVGFRPARGAPSTMAMLKEEISVDDPGPAVTPRPGI